MDVYTDHQGLQYFNTKRKLNQRQAAWQKKLADFHYMIHYRLGPSMGKPDGITRRTGDEKAGLEQRLFNEGQLDLSPNVNKGQEDPNVNPRMLENLIRRKSKDLHENDHGMTDDPEVLQANTDCLVVTRSMYHKNDNQSPNMELNQSPNMELNQSPNMEHNDPDMDVDPYADTDSEAEDMDDMHETHVEDVNVDSIDVAGWEKINGLWQVPPEHRVDILNHCHNSVCTGH